MPTTELSEEDKINRILYVTNLENRITSGDPVKHKRWNDEDTLTYLDECFKNKIEVIEAKANAAGHDLGFPRRSHIFYILARALHSEHVEAGHKEVLAKIANAIIISDQEFFDFLQYCSFERSNKGKHNMAHTILKACKRFYLAKSEVELVESYVRANRYHSWSHKDIFKLLHLNSKKPLQSIIIKHILYDKAPNECVDEQERALIDKMKNSRILKSTSEECVAVPLIHELKCTIQQVSPTLYKSENVWLAALENMSLKESLACLTRLYRAGLLKASSPILRLLVDAYTDSEKVKNSGIHPLEVFIYWKNFEKGGKPMDPKLLDYLRNVRNKTEEDLKKIKSTREVKCASMMTALQKCMHMACSNVYNTHKRYMITIDTTDLMRGQTCITTKTVTCLEAAVAYAHVLLQIEKDVIVATFGETELNFVSLERRGTYAEHYQKIASHMPNFVQYNTPMEWAAANNNVDVFVNFCHHMASTLIPKEIRDQAPKSTLDCLVKYRTRKNLANTKLVIFCPSSIRYAPVRGNYRGVMNAAGFDGCVCRAVDAFCRGFWF